MGRPPRRPPLGVVMNGRRVGELRRETSGAVSFVYAQSWLDGTGTHAASLSLPLREQRYVGETVLNVFDNLLPDTDRMRLRIAERIGIESLDTLDLIAELGRDCAGALQVLAGGAEPGAAGSADGDPIDDDAVADLISNLVSKPLGLDPSPDFRLTLSGAQPKTALLRQGEEWLIPAPGAATSHVLKPQIGRGVGGVDLSDSVENEFLCLTLLEALGVPVAEAELGFFNEVPALIVERTDRHWTPDGRLLRRPMEDFCQALSVPRGAKHQADGGPGVSDIVELLKGSDTPNTDIATFLRANIVLWLIGATDGHAKNFSLYHGPEGRFRLAPLSDVMTAQPLVDEGQIAPEAFRLSMAFGVDRIDAVDEIEARHFVETAQMSGVGRSIIEAILGDLARSAERIAEEALAPFWPDVPERLTDSILAGVRQRARRLG